MFLGSYSLELIGRNRLTLPVRLRREVKGNRLVLASGFDRCILGFEEKKWEEVTAPDLARPLSDPAGRALRRKMFSQAEPVELDSQGRLVIPENMAKYGEIKTGVVVIGAGDHFEIWNEENWQKYLKGGDNL